MNIYHLNCGSIFPLFPRGTQSILYCLLVETNDGLLLVDTGFGIQDYEQPTRFVRLFTAALGLPRSVEETAGHQVEQLGFSREDVRHIVLTHLHNDHAGGIRDFPEAWVHVHALEYEAIQSPKGFKGLFYEPAHWDHGPKWVIHEVEGPEDWFGLPSMRLQPGLSPDVRLIPLPGHSPGHCGIAIEANDRWLLHCGDATYPFYQENEPFAQVKPLPSYIMSPPKWLENALLGQQTKRLRELSIKHGDEIQFICSNDAITYSRCRALSP